MTHSQPIPHTDFMCFVILTVPTDPEAQTLRNNDPDSPVATTVARPKIDCNWTAYLIHRIHILSWIRKYDRSAAVADAISGITLGLTLIPQSIAYAALAGLPSQYGLYSAFAGKHISFYRLLYIPSIVYSRDILIQFTVCIVL